MRHLRPSMPVFIAILLVAPALARADARKEITALFQDQAASFSGPGSFTDAFAGDAFVIFPGHEAEYVAAGDDAIAEGYDRAWGGNQYSFTGRAKVLGVELIGADAAVAAAELTLKRDDDDSGKTKHTEVVRVTAYLTRTDGTWSIKAAQYSLPFSDADLFKRAQGGHLHQLAAVGSDTMPAPLAALLGDPKRLGAATTRKALGFGSAPAEKFIGGDRLKKAFLKWNLQFEPTSVRNGGAWVAANLNTTIKVKGKPTKVWFRALFILDTTGAEPRLVSAHFTAPR